MECSHGRKPVVRVARQDPSPGRGGGNSAQPSDAPAGASMFAPFSFHGLTPVAKRLCPFRGLCVCAVLILVATA